MRLAILITVVVLGLVLALFAPDPFGWQFNLGLAGVLGPIAGGWFLFVRRLVARPSRWKRAVGSFLVVVSIVVSTIVALLAWGDYHRIIFARADADGWRSDLQVLRNAIDRAPAGLRLRAGVTMAPELTSLELALPALDEDQRQARLTRAIAALSDGHSVAFPFFPVTDFALVPLQLKFLSDGLFVVKAAAAQHELVGARVVRIAGLDVEAALALMRPYVSADNESAVRVRAPYYFLSPRLWRAIGRPVDPNRLELQLVSAGTERTVTLPTAARWRYLWWFLEPRDYLFAPKAVAGTPPSAEWRKDPWWLTEMPAERAVYVAFRGVRDSGAETLNAFGARVVQVAQAAHAERIVIDVRENTGGDNTLFAGFVAALRDSEFNISGRLFLLTGGGTFSAATNFVTTMERQTAVVLVGQPTGSGPNHFGDPQPLRLPRTGIVIFLSSRYHQFGGADDLRKAHMPQVPVEASSADYFSGRDPVLAAALRWRSK